MIPGHNQLLAMAIYAKRLFLMAGVTLIAVGAREYGMAVDKIERMSFPVQVVLLMALEALAFAMAAFAIIRLQMAGRAMSHRPVHPVIDRTQIHSLGMTGETVTHLFDVAVAGLALHHGRQMLIHYISARCDTSMAGFALDIILDMFGMGKAGDVCGNARISNGVVGVFVAHYAFGIFIVAGITRLHGRQKIIRRQAAGLCGSVAIRAGGTDILRV